MLGHKVFQSLVEQGQEVVGTIRGTVLSDPVSNFITSLGPVHETVDAMSWVSVEGFLNSFLPEVVVNAIGLIKQRAASRDPLTSITTNAAFPHRLARWGNANACRLIHISTDCVFSGSRGAYTEDDLPDATDLYGRTKLLGEIGSPGLTIRTSFVGRELSNHKSLMEWFISENGTTVRGFQKALYSGITTLEASEIIRHVIDAQPQLSGLYHLAGPPISKYDLLCKIRDQMKLDIEVIPEASFRIDRTIVGDRFVRDTGITVPAWDEMIADMVSDPTPYEELR